MGPFVFQPVPNASGMGVEVTPMTGGGRGMMTGGRFGAGRGWNEQQREYYDLDAPQNNRAVLDYGDL